MSILLGQSRSAEAGKQAGRVYKQALLLPKKKKKVKYTPITSLLSTHLNWAVKMLQDDEVFGGLLEQIHHSSKQRSLITIRDSLDNSKHDDCSVFPPVNHENLHIPSHHSRDHQNQQHPPSDLVMRGLPASSKQVVVGWLDIGREILRAKICCVYSWFCDNGDTRGARSKRWLFGPAAGMAVLVMWWWFCRRIKWGWSRKESVEHLKMIIKDKDEEINKLLHQIAQMNQVLLARHKVLASKLAN